jgi:hypothetical protein
MGFLSVGHGLRHASGTVIVVATVWLVCMNYDTPIAANVNGKLASSNDLRLLSGVPDAGPYVDGGVDHRRHIIF